MGNFNTLKTTIDESVVNYIIYDQTNEYQRKNYHNRYYLAFEKCIRLLIGKKEHLTIIDGPCGSGIGTYYIAEQLTKCNQSFTIYGIDLCKDAIDYARINYRCGNIIWCRDDICNSLSHLQYDAFICMEFLEHVPMDIAKYVVEQSSKNMNDGGHAIFSSPRLRPRESTTKRPGHINEFSEQEFYYTLEESYPMVERYSFDRYANIVNYTSDANLMVGVCHKWNSTEVFK